MAQGIRVAAKAQFIALSAARLAGEFGPIDSTVAKGNVAFRKAVTSYLEDTFKITHPSACTAYNWAKDTVGKEQPELVVSLGRAADKKGGRKPGSKNATVAAPETEVVATEGTVTEAASEEVVATEQVEEAPVAVKAPKAAKVAKAPKAAKVAKASKKVAETV